MLNTSTPC